MKAKIKAGTTSRILDVYVEDSSSSTGAGLGSLVYNSSGLTCKYKRRGQSSWTTVSLVTATAGTWTSGGFVAAGSAPTGAYEFHVPDAALASGATGVVIILEGATNMVPCRIEIELDAIDYQDTVRMGLTALPNVAQGNAGQLPTADANGKVLLQATQTGVTIPTVSSVTDKTGYALTAAYDAAKTAAPTPAQVSTQVAADLAAAHGSGSWQTATGFSTLNESGVRAAVGLASANLDTQLGTIAGYIDTEIGSLISAVATVDAKADAILEDTGTTIPALFPANFAALGINASGHISRVTLVDTTTTNTDMRGTDGAYTGTPATPTEIRQEIDANSTRLAEIVDDTTALQTDWADGGRLDLLLDQVIAYFTTARGEPAQGAPPVSAPPLEKIDYLYKVMRNKADQSDSEQRIYNDDGTTVGHKRSVSVADGVVTLGEIVSGP